MDDSEQHRGAEKWAVDWRLNIQTILAVFVLFGAQTWYFSAEMSRMGETIANTQKQVDEFRQYGTPGVRAEIAAMKARADALDGRLDRIEDGIERLDRKLDSVIENGSRRK